MVWQKFLENLKERFFSPERLVNYFVKLVNVIIIIAIGVAIYLIITKTLRKLFKKKLDETAARRTRTILPLINNLLKYIIFFFVLIMVLHEIGVDYSAILAGAGIVGLAVGFGAQTLVRDVISGFFLLFEDTISVGDVITVGNESGVVESIGLRATQFREFSGLLRVIPNGELTRFGNFNRGFMRAIVNINLAYEQDATKGMAVALETAKQWANENKEIVLEEPLVQGILDFGSSGVVVRVVVKVKPQTQWEAERELRLRIKKAFDEAGIEIPFERRVIYTKSE
ncbi:MAG: mechanosensitive ion channel family protein [candidate division WOR-3 bacterium]